MWRENPRQDAAFVGRMQPTIKEQYKHVPGMIRKTRRIKKNRCKKRGGARASYSFDKFSLRLIKTEKKIK